MKTFVFIKKIAMFCADIIAVALSAVFAFILLNENAIDLPTFLLVFGCNAFALILVLCLLGLYNVVFSSVGMVDIIKCAMAVVFIGIANLVFVLITKQEIVDIVSLLVYLVFLFCLISLIRSS